MLGRFVQMLAALTLLGHEWGNTGSVSSCVAAKLRISDAKAVMPALNSYQTEPVNLTDNSCAEMNTSSVLENLIPVLCK